MAIKFHYDIKNFRVTESKRIKSVGYEIIKKAGKRRGSIDVIFTTDEEIYKINVEFLKHNYFTDIITFNYSEKGIIVGEIYISAESVRENARSLDVSLKSEIRRVFFHGILHLCGYNDESEEEKVIMRGMEDYYIEMADKK